MTDDLTPERAREMWMAANTVAKHADAFRGTLAAWERDRARLATVTAQRDALVPLAGWALDGGVDNDLTDDKRIVARAALAAIRAEREEGTTLRIHSMSAHKILHGTDA